MVGKELISVVLKSVIPAVIMTAGDMLVMTPAGYWLE